MSKTKFLIVDKRKRVGNLDTPHYAVQRIQDTLDKMDIPHDFCHFDQISTGIENGKLVMYALEQPLTDYTHVIMRGHRREEFDIKKSVALYAKQNDIKVQNSDFILKMPNYNKYFQMIMMPPGNIPYLDSYYTPSGLYHQHPKQVEKLGFPLIYKHVFGEYRVENIDGKDKLKKNVYLIEDMKQLQKECVSREDVDATDYFIQEFTDIGKDVRLIMIGGKFYGGWERVATKGFLTVSKNHEYHLMEYPPEEYLELADRTIQLFESDYCALDIIESDGKPYVLEINMDPGYKAFETKLEGGDFDVAQAIVDNMLVK